MLDDTLDQKSRRMFNLLLRPCCAACCPCTCPAVCSGCGVGASARTVPWLRTVQRTVPWLRAGGWVS